jgi:hypothetical protein
MTQHGQRRLAHALTHVVQQRVERVHNPYGSGVAVGVVQKMDSNPWSYDKYVAQPPQKEWREQRSEEAQNFAMELAKAAFQHMRSLVIRYNKDGTKGFLASQDIDALYIYGAKNMSAKEIGAVAMSGERVLIATNSTVPQKGVEAFQEYYASKNIETVDSAPLGENQLCMHAEIKIFRNEPGIGYIGVSKLCCLYCAAQLLASGFAGFRGCSMVAFNNYQWLPDVSKKTFQKILWGEEVAEVLARAPSEIKDLFMFYISQGSTLMQRLQEDKVISSSYSKNKHPLSDVFPKGYSS